MNEDAFWTLIQQLDWDRTGNDDAVVEPLVLALAAMPTDEIRAFQEILARKLYALDGPTWYAEAGEPSGDEFLYQRCVVVANGRPFFEGVLADPSKMPKELEFESLLYIARTAEERKLGHSDGIETEVSYESFSNAAAWGREV